MKKILFTLLTAALVLPAQSYGQRLCGMELVKAAMIARDPSWAAKFEAQRASLQGIADRYKAQHKAGAAERTTAVRDTIPIIFHVILDSAQYAQIGGWLGVQQRAISQIAVLNADYNRANSDSTLIPYGWKPLYANVGIQFGLAHTQPNGWGSPGFEIKIISSTGFNGADTSYKDAKHSTLGPGAESFSSGLDGWDNTKYLNVWVVNFSDVSGLLGITVARSFTTGSSEYTSADVGVCINYSAFGKRASPSDFYYRTGYGSDYYDMGRTLTHEIGHVFEIWHTWGDDGGLCPWNGGNDDGLADTPPEGDSKYYNYPDTIPGGTYFDQCRRDGSIDTEATTYGVASLDYMNYTDDIAMHMFTIDQGAVMASQVAPGGESYSLTQNPGLLSYPADAGIAQSAINDNINIFPNPTTGHITVAFDQKQYDLLQINVFNIMGQEVQNIDVTGQQKDFYSIDLSGMSKGIYIVRCNFASGSITRKILLQ